MKNLYVDTYGLYVAYFMKYISFPADSTTSCASSYSIEVPENATGNLFPRSIWGCCQYSSEDWRYVQCPGTIADGFNANKLLVDYAFGYGWTTFLEDISSDQMDQIEIKYIPLFAHELKIKNITTNLNINMSVDYTWILPYLDWSIGPDRSFFIKPECCLPLNLTKFPNSCTPQQ